MIAYHKDTPEDNDTDDVDGRGPGGQGLSESGKDDEQQFQSIHALTTEYISSSAEADLPNDRAGRCRELDGCVGGCRHLAFAWEVDNAEHEGQKRDGEDVVRVCEETDTGNGNGPNVIPSERCSVDFGEGESSPLVGILDVKKVIVKVVVGVVASGSLLRDIHGLLSRWQYRIIEPLWVLKTTKSDLVKRLGGPMGTKGGRRAEGLGSYAVEENRKKGRSWHAWEFIL